MRTALIRILPAVGGAHEVQLFSELNGGDWRDQTPTTASIPADLGAPAAPRIGDAPATVDGVRRWLLEQPLAPDPRSALFGELGQWLRGLLLHDAVAQAWKELGHAAGRGGVRLLLDVDRDSGLAGLPWELVAGDGPLPLFASARSPCARVHALEPARGETDCYPLLRVLVVKGAAPEDQGVQADEEVEELRDALAPVWGLVDLEELDRPTVDELRNAYDSLEPHVLHFVGHGRVEAGNVVLAIAPKGAQGGWSWQSASIAGMLEGAPPKLAVLNTCRSMSFRQPGGGWEITDAFAQLNVPAVVGMQGDITGTSAVTFTRTLYQALVAEKPLDVAVAEARKAVANDAGWDTPDPWLPCLTLSAAPEGVMPTRYAIAAHLANAVLGVKHFGRVQTFVDRREARRLLWQDTGEHRPPGDGPGVVVVTGVTRSGMSALMCWCLAARALRGVNVAYVELDKVHSVGGRKLLEQIVEALSSSPVYAEDNTTALAGVREAIERREDDPTVLFEGFTQALDSLAGRGAPLIAIDHVSSIESGVWGGVVRRLLIEPAAAGNLPVRLVLGVGTEYLDDRFGVTLRPPKVPWVRLTKLPANEYEEVTTRFMRAHGIPRATFAELQRSLQPSEGEEWDAGRFVLLESAIELMGWRQAGGG